MAWHFNLLGIIFLVIAVVCRLARAVFPIWNRIQRRSVVAVNIVVLFVISFVAAWLRRH